MPIDPSIILKATRPAPLDVGGAAVNHVNVRNAAADVLGKQRAMAQEDALMRTVQDPHFAGLSGEQRMLALAGVSPLAGTKMGGDMLAAQGQDIQNRTGEFALDDAQKVAAQKHLDRLISAVSVQPDGATAKKYVAQAVQDGWMDPDSAARAAQMIPDDPAQWPATQATLNRMLMDAKDRLAQTTQAFDLGNRTVVAQTPTYGGGPTVETGSFGAGVDPNTKYQVDAQERMNNADNAAALAKADQMRKAGVVSGPQVSLAKTFGAAYEKKTGKSAVTLLDPATYKIYTTPVAELKKDPASAMQMAYIIAKLNDPTGRLSNQDVEMSTGGTIGSWLSKFGNSVEGDAALANSQIENMHEIITKLYDANAERVYNGAKASREQAMNAGVPPSLLPVVTLGAPDYMYRIPASDGNKAEMLYFDDFEAKASYLSALYNVDPEDIAVVNERPDLLPQFAEANGLTLKEAQDFLDGF
jgi:hypothetical protein